MSKKIDKTTLVSTATSNDAVEEYYVYEFAKRIDGGLITIVEGNRVVSLREGGFDGIEEASQKDLAYLKSQGHPFVGVKSNN